MSKHCYVGAMCHDVARCRIMWAVTYCVAYVYTKTRNGRKTKYSCNIDLSAVILPLTFIFSVSLQESRRLAATGAHLVRWGESAQEKSAGGEAESGV